MLQRRCQDWQKRSLLNCLTKNKLTFPLLKLHLNALLVRRGRARSWYEKQKQQLTERQACIYFIWVNRGEECRNAGIWIHELWTTNQDVGCLSSPCRGWHGLDIIDPGQVEAPGRGEAVYVFPEPGAGLGPREVSVDPGHREAALQAPADHAHLHHPEWERSYFFVSSKLKLGKLSEQY